MTSIEITLIETYLPNVAPLLQEWHVFEVTSNGKFYGTFKTWQGLKKQAVRPNGETADFKWLNDTLVFLTGFAYNSFEVKVN